MHFANMMWLHLISVALLPLLVASRVILHSPHPDLDTYTFPTLLHSLNNTFGDFLQSPALAADGDPPPTPRSEAWQKYECRGQRLWQAMTTNKDEAVEHLTPIDSPFDSTLEEELKRWGYIERNSDADDQCMFDTYLRQPLEAMGIDPKGGVRGGPNECFYFQHYDPNMKDNSGFLVPGYQQKYTVDGRTYRVCNMMLCSFTSDLNRRLPGPKQSLASTQRVEWSTSSTSFLLLRAPKRLGVCRQIRPLISCLS